MAAVLMLVHALCGAERLLKQRDLLFQTWPRGANSMAVKYVSLDLPILR
jgi:hypothetical protein